MIRGQRGRQRPGQRAHRLDRVGVAIRGVDVVAFAQEVDEVAAGAAPHVHHPHARGDSAAQQLIEQVDVDVPEAIEDEVAAHRRRFTQGTTDDRRPTATMNAASRSQNHQPSR